MTEVCAADYGWVSEYKTGRSATAAAGHLKEDGSGCIWTLQWYLAIQWHFYNSTNVSNIYIFLKLYTKWLFIGKESGGLHLQCNRFSGAKGLWNMGSKSPLDSGTNGISNICAPHRETQTLRNYCLDDKHGCENLHILQFHICEAFFRHDTSIGVACMSTRDTCLKRAGPGWYYCVSPSLREWILKHSGRNGSVPFNPGELELNWWEQGPYLRG